MTRSIHRDLLLPLAAFFLAGDVINNKNRYSHAAFSKFEESAFSAGLVEHQYFSQESSDRNVAVRNHRSLATLPLGLVNQTKEEENYLKLHKCRDPGEAYGASYLITKEHLINQFTGLNLSWVNCEMGSFIMMNHRANPKKNVNGSITQTLDVLDFAVVHLSWYERLQKRHAKKMKEELKIVKSDERRMKELHSSSAIISTIEMLKTRALKLRDPLLPFPVPELNRTVAVMPFLGSDMGAGHSNLGNRLNYLSACFWSVYSEIPYVVAVVKYAADAHFAMNVSGLPFYDVILLSDLPKSASLPVATVQQSKARIIDGRWDFDYLYFTESDQILMMRIHQDIYDHLKTYPRRLVIPHRLNPYPVDLITHIYKKNTSDFQPMDWLDMNCCLPRQNCDDRKEWVSMHDPRVKVANIFGLQVALGNVNFHAESYRYCNLNEMGDQPYCP